jgi:hypothetical protein
MEMKRAEPDAIRWILAHQLGGNGVGHSKPFTDQALSLLKVSDFSQRQTIKEELHQLTLGAGSVLAPVGYCMVAVPATADDSQPSLLAFLPAMWADPIPLALTFCLPALKVHRLQVPRA